MSMFFPHFTCIELSANLFLLAAIMTEVTQTGQGYFQVRHFLTRGIPASLMSFGLMYVAGL